MLIWRTKLCRESASVISHGGARRAYLEKLALRSRASVSSLRRGPRVAGDVLLKVDGQDVARELVWRVDWWIATVVSKYRATKTRRVLAHHKSRLETTRSGACTTGSAACCSQHSSSQLLPGPTRDRRDRRWARVGGAWDMRPSAPRHKRQITRRQQGDVRVELLDERLARRRDL